MIFQFSGDVWESKSTVPSFWISVTRLEDTARSLLRETYLHILPCQGRCTWPPRGPHLHVSVEFTVSDHTCCQKGDQDSKDDHNTCMIQDLFFISDLRSGIRLRAQSRSDFLPHPVSAGGFAHVHPPFLSHRQNHIPRHDTRSDFWT